MATTPNSKKDSSPRRTESAIAHVRADCVQSLEDHLEGVARLAGKFAAKFQLSDYGELIGLVHDLGKYSAEFQAYIKSATGVLNQDEDEEYVDADELRGKIDHSTSGAQFLWNELSGKSGMHRAMAQVLALCVASHHSGLIDCLTSKAGRLTEDGFSKRMGKANQKTHLQEVLEKLEPGIRSKAQSIIAKEGLTDPLQKWFEALLDKAPGATRDDKGKSPVLHFQHGFLVRALFSCLIDADRIDTADFEHPGRARGRYLGSYAAWGDLIRRLELHISRYSVKYPIDEIRRDVSRHCQQAATRETGIYTLTVPTGGGKTLASLRFALHHANQHSLDRVIYVIPFTSIIDQNAEVVRQILEPEGVDPGSVVLEHHSNLTPDKQSWRGKILSENWDAPVVYTTTVQLLEALFGSGTRGARRMHQLANAVLVFDEIQTLPINCVHLFNNAMNFLANHCKTTVVLCTATQPLLHKVEPSKGAIHLKNGHEIMPDVAKLFEDLKRVDVVNARKPGGWSHEAVAELALSQAAEVGSCLVIVNTKKSAQAIYELCAGHLGTTAFHLSTSMCPAHRKDKLNEMRLRLDAQPGLTTLCVSTQLIEAGVDVDFGSVIRFTAGLDSIAQAAGRCNRNGRSKRGFVHVVNPRAEDENLSRLTDIRIGRDKAEGVLNDFEAAPENFGGNCIGLAAMERYYRDYFFARAADMSYPISPEIVGRDDDLFNMFSTNSKAVSDYAQSHRQAPKVFFRQSFMSASKAFKAIDAPTQGVIVPHTKAGKDLIADLCAAYLPDKEFELLRRAQQFSVNVFSHQLEALSRANAVREIRPGTGILYLADARYYSAEFGLTDVPRGSMEVLFV